MESELELVCLENGRGVRLECIRVGASITSLQLPNNTDVVLGFRDYKDYRTNSPYIGCIVVWKLKSQTSNEAVFEHASPAGTEGYPGTLSCTVTYRVTEESEVHLNYAATADAPTIVSLTSHTYFNLAGKARQLAIFWITSFVFLLTGQLIWMDPASGNGVEVYSDQPGMQLYTGNFLDGSHTGRAGEPMARHCGVCLETQAWPNAINIEGARDQVILRPGERYTAKTVWKLSWKD
ncbi:Galactose mutarotase [Geodia barretti]|uniref:Galactose mutarotase n=1 Tax=Geodia barretti TaxID=519541 RepID=A0AA35RI61_GEOBA|nr:Galactose mutarotase [Geodia barretti]